MFSENENLDFPFVSVIVLNYNGVKYLTNLFDSLANTNYPDDKLEIIMGDNASSDKSVEIVQKNYSFVRIIRFDINYGFCKGNNMCAKAARGQFLVFLNTDTIVTKDWLKNLVNSVCSKKNVISAGAKLIKPYEIDGKKIIDFAGGKLTYEINFYDGRFDYDSEKYSHQKITGFGCGAAVIVNRKFFTDIGGFDEYYFGGGEEVELGLRAWQYGYQVLYVPSAIVYHYRYGTFKSTDTFPTYSWVKSMFFFIFKNYEKKNMLFYFCESIFFTQLPKLLVFIVNKQFTMAKSLLKGMFDFLIELKSKDLLSTIYQKRNEIKNHRVITDKELSNLKITTTFSERMRYRIKIYRHWKLGKC